MASKSSTPEPEQPTVPGTPPSLRDMLINHPGSNTFVAPRYPKWDWEKNPICEAKVLQTREAKTMRDGKSQVLTVIDIESGDDKAAIICTRNLRNMADKVRPGDSIVVQYTGWLQETPGAAPSRGFKCVIQHTNGQVELA